MVMFEEIFFFCHLNTKISCCYKNLNFCSYALQLWKRERERGGLQSSVSRYTA